MQHSFGNEMKNLASTNVIIHRETERKCFFYIYVFMGVISKFSKLDVYTARLILERTNDPFRRYSSKNLLWK